MELTEDRIREIVKEEIKKDRQELIQKKIQRRKNVKEVLVKRQTVKCLENNF